MLYLLNSYVFQCEMAAITENNQWDHLDPTGKPGIRGKQDLSTALCRRYQLSTFCKV